MSQKVIPILCHCGAKIDVTPEMLDGKYDCLTCGTPIDFELYEPLVAIIDSREAARRLEKQQADAEKKRNREIHRQAERAEAERVRAERVRVEMEHRAAEARLRAEEEYKHPLGPTPTYSFLGAVSTGMRILGGMCIATTLLLILILIFPRSSSQESSQKAAGFLSTLIYAGSTFIIGLFYVAIGEGLSAFRDIAIKTHLIAEKRS